MIRSVADAFGDLERASEWLGEQLGISGRMLAVSAEPVSLVAEAGHRVIHGERAIGAARTRIRRIRFIPERPAVPKATCQSIDRADLSAMERRATSTLPAWSSTIQKTPALLVSNP